MPPRERSVERFHFHSTSRTRKTHSSTALRGRCRGECSGRADKQERDSGGELHLRRFFWVLWRMQSNEKVMSAVCTALKQIWRAERRRAWDEKKLRNFNFRVRHKAFRLLKSEDSLKIKLNENISKVK